MAKEQINKDADADEPEIIVENAPAVDPHERPARSGKEKAPVTDGGDDQVVIDRSGLSPEAAAEKAAEKTDSQKRNHEKREREKERVKRAKETQRRDRERADNLDRKNAELEARLAKIEGHATESDKARLDDTLANTEAAIGNLRQQRLQAIKDQNLPAIDELDQALFELRMQKRELDAMKKRSTNGADRSKETDKGAGGGNGADKGAGGGGGFVATPEEKEIVAEFLESQDWLDPRGGDLDSRKALAIDREMIQEGYRPSDTDWKDELTSRLKDALPHRFDDVGDGEARERNGSGKRRGPPVGGRGREGGQGGAQSFRLTDFERDALEQSGSEPGTPAYKRIIKSYHDNWVKSGSPSRS